MARPTGVSYRNFEAPFDKWSTEAKNEWLCKRDSPPTHGATAASIAKQHRDQSAGHQCLVPWLATPDSVWTPYHGCTMQFGCQWPFEPWPRPANPKDIRFASIPPGQVLNVEYVHPPACLPCAPLSSGSKLSIEALMAASGDFAAMPITTIPALFCFDTFAQRYTTYTTPEEDGTKSLDYADGGVVDTPAVCGAVSQGATKIVSVISFPDALKSGKGPFVATEGEPCTWKVDPDSAYIQFVAQYFGQGPYSSGAVAPLGAPGMLNQIFANQNDQCDDLFQSLMEQFQRKQEKGEALVAYLKDVPWWRSRDHPRSPEITRHEPEIRTCRWWRTPSGESTAAAAWRTLPSSSTLCRLTGHGSSRSTRKEPACRALRYAAQLSSVSSLLAREPSPAPTVAC